MTQKPQEERVVAVFPDEDTARQAAVAAREAGAEDVDVGAGPDEVRSLGAEMQATVGEGNVGFFTPEMMRAIPRWTAIAALVGVALALPFGFDSAGSVPPFTRFAAVAVIGAVVGGTIGFIVGAIVSGGFLGTRRNAESELAAEEGVVVGAQESTDAVTPTLGGRGPIRLDRIAPTGPSDGAATRKPEGDGGRG